MYTISDIAEFSGLSDRTVRTYLKMGILKGEKIGNEWQFDEMQVSDFLSHPSVKPSIEAKGKALIYDFLADTKKKGNDAVFILDLYKDELMNVGMFFCEQANSHSSVKMKFDKKGNFARVILSGNEKQILDVLANYYANFKSKIEKENG